MKPMRTVALIAFSIMLAGCDTDDDGSVLGVTDGSVHIGPASDAIEGSGAIVTHVVDVNNFSEIEVSHTFNVAITQGDSFSVSVRVDDNMVEHLRVERTESKLQFGLKDGSNNNITLEASVVVPDLDYLDVNGVSRVEVLGFELDHDLELDCSGASRISETVHVTELEIDVSGASQLLIEGSASRLELDASGASSAGLKDFPVATADVHLSGASSATLRVQETLEVTASGASRLSFHGTPSPGRVSTSGASTITSLD